MIYNFHSLGLLLTISPNSTQSLIHTLSPQLTATLLLLRVYSYIPISFNRSYSFQVQQPKLLIQQQCSYVFRNNPLRSEAVPTDNFSVKTNSFQTIYYHSLTTKYTSTFPYDQRILTNFYRQSKNYNTLKIFIKLVFVIRQ
jgi:hypothetical protein